MGCRVSMRHVEVSAASSARSSTFRSTVRPSPGRVRPSPGRVAHRFAPHSPTRSQMAVALDEWWKIVARSFERREGLGERCGEVAVTDRAEHAVVASELDE